MGSSWLARRARSWRRALKGAGGAASNRFLRERNSTRVVVRPRTRRREGRQDQSRPSRSSFGGTRTPKENRFGGKRREAGAKKARRVDEPSLQRERPVGFLVASVRFDLHRGAVLDRGLEPSSGRSRRRRTQD